MCLFDPDGVRDPDSRWTSRPTTSGTATFRASVRGSGTGSGCDGPYDPSRGLRHNPNKLLIDPYARAIEGDFIDDPAVYGGDEDSAPYVPRSVIVHGAFPWGGDRRPDIPWDDTVIYELHVKRLHDDQHPDIPPELRGTYAGLAHPAAIDYLRSLGVTAVELLPIHHFVTEPALLRRGLPNYWGYNSLGFFAPHAAYSSRGAATRCASSSRWCGPCTPPASRSSSTWSTTTPPRAPRTVRSWPSAASTTPPTTGSAASDPVPLRRLHRLRQHPRRPHAVASCS